MRIPRPSIALLAPLALVAVACGSAASGESSPPPSEVTVVQPAEGATVEGPVDVAVLVEGLVVEPAGEVRDGAGHVHIVIDGPCVEPGESIPFDDQHVHLGDGSTSTVLELEPGVRTLCVQVGDGFHTALDAGTDTVTFTVSD